MRLLKEAERKVRGKSAGLESQVPSSRRCNLRPKKRASVRRNPGSKGGRCGQSVPMRLDRDGNAWKPTLLECALHQSFRPRIEASNRRPAGLSSPQGTIRKKSRNNNQPEKNSQDEVKKIIPGIDRRGANAEGEEHVKSPKSREANRPGHHHPSNGADGKV